MHGLIRCHGIRLARCNEYKQMPGATYNTCCSIPAMIWLAVIDVDLTAVALKASGTLTLVCINKVL